MKALEEIFDDLEQEQGLKTKELNFMHNDGIYEQILNNVLRHVSKLV